MNDVPCNGCTACCQNDLLFLHPELGDRAEDYDTMPAVHPITGKPGLALRHKPTGGCIYLQPDGCSIHGRAPAICREFDCRKFVQALGGRPARRRAVMKGWASREVIHAGIRLLVTATDTKAG